MKNKPNQSTTRDRKRDKPPHRVEASGEVKERRDAGRWKESTAEAREKRKKRRRGEKAQPGACAGVRLRSPERRREITRAS